MQLLLFLALPLLVFADGPTSRPEIVPPVDFQGAIEKGLQEHLPSTPWHITQWNQSMLPLGCQRVAHQYNTSVTQLEIFEVKYDDCSQPWVMCRHVDAKVDANTMAQTFGKIPLGMREYVKNLEVLKSEKLTAAYAASYNDTIAVADDPFYLYAMAQEMMHSIDWHVKVLTNVNTVDGPTSESSTWRDHHEKSDAVVSTFAKSTWQDNLAETGVLSLYDTVVPDGLPAIQPNWTQIFPQYSLLQAMYRGIFTPGTKTNCTQRLQDSIVPYDDNCNGTTPSTAVPNSNGTKTIPISAAASNFYSLVRYDWNGTQPSG
ncbi:hypothetical protein F5Y13DRAFT_194531 [Hypoxylon sp. FL1857]|nr:hypothetical protein F5Y13DRAFT_194531 [Hypoxylon sp. FL1857]